jgi:hypothetical protein
MRTARALGILVLALHAVAQGSRALGAATFTADVQWAPLPSAAFEKAVLDRSRERSLEQALPFHSTRTGAREYEFNAILARISPQSILQTHTVVKLGQDPGGTTPQPAAAASVDSHGQVTSALNQFELTPIQRLSVRDFVGETKAEVVHVTVNDKEVLILRDTKTHEYIGEATISRREDGSVVVSKLTGATFDTSTSVELPISSRQTEQAEKVLGGSRSITTFNSEQDKAADIELSVPAISLSASAEYGPVAESVAVFKPDGSGYERGLRTNLASVTGGAEAGVSGRSDGDGFAGAKAGAGAEALKVELFANYFSAPEADENGQFTRNVLGASGEAHVTLAELQGQLGCNEDGGCGASMSAGLLGIGAGFGFTYGAEVKLERGSSAGVPEDGLASSEEQFAAADQVAPAPVERPGVPVTASPAVFDDLQIDDEDGDAIDDDEQDSFEAAVEDGSIEALEEFLTDYPDSVYEGEVSELVEEARDPLADPDDETLIY